MDKRMTPCPRLIRNCDCGSAYCEARKPQVRKADMSDNKYQGWANRETWCVALWMDNEQHTQNACMTLAQEAAGAHEAARLIEEYVEGEITADGMRRDLINCCLARCNWIELAEHFRAE